MRKLLLPVAFALLVLPVSIASADPIAVGDTFKFIDRPGSPGGEFGVVDDSVASPTTFDSFVTFCVQKGEYLNFSDVFRVAAIGSQDSAGVTLKAGTAWLYGEFSKAGYGALGTAGGANYVGNAASANGLQKALWYFQGQDPALATVTGDTFGNAYYNLVVAALGIGTLFDNYAGTHVRILQVVYNDNGAQPGRAAQDQLVIPEPASLLLLGAGLVGIASRLRRRR